MAWGAIVTAVVYTRFLTRPKCGVGMWIWAGFEKMFDHLPSNTTNYIQFVIRLGDYCTSLRSK